eukprot:TRINITY_DN1117_c0_g4_i7.p1 TRINITY_DN1117_c0_g4~~TRINITY_DN1117_c0_g4_i7.p1  ORF type:complete len:359 (-),score=49.23 TRINITY_DN1117_c0_g4_i7:356-1432(-)
MGQRATPSSTMALPPRPPPTAHPLLLRAVAVLTRCQQLVVIKIKYASCYRMVSLKKPLLSCKRMYPVNPPGPPLPPTRTRILSLSLSPLSPLSLPYLLYLPAIISYAMSHPTLTTSCVDAEPRVRPGAHYGLGKTYYELEQYHQAKEHLEIACDLKKDNADFHASAGDVCMKVGDPGCAKTHYSTAIELHLGLKDWTVILDYVGPGGQVKSKKARKSLRRLRKVESLVFNLLDAYHWEPGTLYAAKLFDLASALDPSNPQLHDEAAVVQVGTGLLNQGYRHTANATFMQADASIKENYSYDEIDYRRRALLFSTQLQSGITQLARTLLLSKDADDLWTVVRSKCGYDVKSDFVGRQVC